MNLNETSDDAVPVTPSDAGDLPFRSRGLIVGGAGVIHGITKLGREITITVPAGNLPIRFKKIFATSTTATNIISFL